MDNNQNITPDQKDFDELTIETQSFLITFITNLSTVAMRAIAKNKLDKTAAYHDYRQLLIYYNALLEMLYSEELADDVLEAFDTQAPENIVENDENIIDNYNQFFGRFYEYLSNIFTFKQRRLMRKILKSVKSDLDASYGYESGLVI